MGRRILVTIAFALLTTAIAPSTYAPTAITAAQILRRAAAAEGALAPGAYRVVVRSTEGGLATVRTTYLDGDDYLSRSVAGPFVTAEGHFAGRDWEQDENGIVTSPSGFLDREDPNAKALADPKNPLYRVRVLGIAGSPRQLVLSLDPAGGDRELRFYDAATYLLTRTERIENDGLTHVDTYDDYRNVYGLKHAFHRTSSDGRPENDYVADVVSYERVAAPPDMHPPANRSLFSFASDAPIVLPVRLVEGRLVVRATIAGRGLDFALDSGSSEMTINPDVARQLGLVAYDHTSASLGGSFGVARTIVPAMEIGGARLANATVSEVAVSDSMPGTQIVGLLGHDFFASGVVSIDFARGTLTLYPRGRAPLADPALARVAVETDGGLVRVPLTIAGVAGHFLLDTGAGDVVAYQRFYDRLPASTLLPGTWSMGFVGGVVDAKKYRVADMAFGGVTWPSAEIFVPQAAIGEIEGYDGLLGRTALRDLAIYFDYADNAIYVRRRLGAEKNDALAHGAFELVRKTSIEGRQAIRLRLGHRQIEAVVDRMVERSGQVRCAPCVRPRRNDANTVEERQNADDRRRLDAGPACLPKRVQRLGYDQIGRRESIFLA